MQLLSPMCCVMHTLPSVYITKLKRGQHFALPAISQLVLQLRLPNHLYYNLVIKYIFILNLGVHMTDLRIPPSCIFIWT
jgi:hypothetical protein